jgi:hypothetical protein
MHALGFGTFFYLLVNKFLTTNLIHQFDVYCILKQSVVLKDNLF